MQERLDKKALSKAFQIKSSFEKKEQTIREMSLGYTIVDAFCVPEKQFSGNPAAVCLLEYDVQ